MQIAVGASRRALLVGRWAIKLPHWRNGAIFWLRGLLANMYEAERWRLSGHPALARVVWCAPLGLLLVAERHGPLVGRLLTRDELAVFPFTTPDCIDNNGHNIAVSPDGGFVLLDYGDYGMWLVVVDAEGQRLYPHQDRG